MLSFPTEFRLPDLAAITGVVCELKPNPLQQQASANIDQWMDELHPYEDRTMAEYRSHRFDDLTGLSYPHADLLRLETCVLFNYWAFSFDDVGDIELVDRANEHQKFIDIVLAVFKSNDLTPPTYPYAAMLHFIWNRLKANSSPGACARFAHAVELWCKGQIDQMTARADEKILPVEEFMDMRREVFGEGMAKAIIEFVTDVHLPDYIFEDPAVMRIMQLSGDMTTWTNDVCSFNKEQANGDYQNVVCSMMVERGVGLQEAIDIIVDILTKTVEEYADLKSKLPSWGPKVDEDFARYLKGVEHFIQGTNTWYYSRRYFRDIDISDRRELIVPVFPRDQSSC